VSGEAILCVANVSRSAQAVELDLSAYVGRVPVEMMGGAKFPPVGQLPYLLTLPPYGFYWFLLAAEAQLPSWHVPAPEPMPEYVTLVVRKEFAEILDGPARRALEIESLPRYLPMRRWYAGKDRKLLSTRIVASTMLPMVRPPVLLAEIEAANDAGSERYLLPLSFMADDAANAALPQQLALARLRRSGRVGFLTDAAALDALPRLMVELLRQDQRLPASDGELRFTSTPLLQALDLPPGAEVRRLATEQSNSSVVIGERVIVKLLRRLAAGVHPEAEMTLALAARGYANLPPLYGEVTRVAADGTPFVLALVQGFMDNQGDAWTWIGNILERAIRDVPAAPGDLRGDVLAELGRFAAVLGRRLGQMHLALAQPAADPAFAPERLAPGDCEQIGATACARIEGAMRALAAPREWPSAVDAARAQWLLARQDQLAAAAMALAAGAAGSLRMRIHGDLHLGQALVVQDDVYFIDFEGEPARPLAERRAKASPLRDVGGMIRSFDYALSVSGDAGARVRDEAALAAQSHLLRQCRSTSVDAFLAAYREAAAPIPHRWCGDAAEAGLVNLFTLEKAAYEIGYEAAHRPAQLHVPVGGMVETAVRIGVADAPPERPA
jgi:maltose alpha-D-glucosyltransferase/alpha-amylase